MLTIQGTRRRLCDGVSRRDFLALGGLSALGLTLADTLAPQAAAARPGAGKARACILLFPYGSPPQHETFDPKPDAPPEVRGEMGAIPTAVPGVRIGEGLPRIARILDRITIVRSVTHPFPVHGVAYAVTGIPTYTPELETRPRDGRHWPFLGSVVDYLDERRSGNRLPVVPRNIALPWMLNSKTDVLVNAGPFAAFLGQAHDPVWTDFDGPGLRVGPKVGSGQVREYLDPFAATSPAGRFRVASGENDVAIESINLRRSLLAQFDAAQRRLGPMLDAGVFDRQQQQAFSLLTSGTLRRALDLGREPMAVREAYGMTLFGQGCLVARRLVEAGCRFVTVFWDGYGPFGGCAWDTHANHFPRLRDYLLPGLDYAYPALILDLEQRGLLDETLVLWLSEHGRTPQIDSKPKGAGRHHWSRAYSVALAGGGVPRGKVVGATDRIAGDVKDTAVSPKDLLATALHLLGHDATGTVPDRQGRPMPVLGDGRVRPELLA
jgi:uncharacterized protein (DUF1501 family)